MPADDISTPHRCRSRGGADPTTRRWLVLASHVPPSGHLGGIIRCTVETTRALAARDDVEVHVHCRAETAPFFTSTLGLARANVHTTTAGSTLRRSIEETRSLAGLLDELAPDVVFGSKQLLPIQPTDAIRILTIHDMLPMDRPGDYGLLKRTLLPRQYRRSIGLADILACVSAASRDRLIHHVPDAAARATVIRNATTGTLRSADPVALHALAGRRFALVVGDFSRRKNVRHVVRLWAAVIAAHPDAVLALAGPSGWGRNQEIPELEPLLASGAAVLLGHVSDGELRWAYEHAVVLLCPSLLEGFGLPVIEAAAFGCPMIISADPALVEAADGRATVVDTADPGAWIAAIDASFARSASRAAADGSVRTWDDTAAELCAAVEARSPAPRGRGVSALPRRPVVAHVTQPITEGAAEATLDLVAHQRALGLEVALVCAPDSPLADRARALGADVLPWTAGRDIGPRLGHEIRSLRSVLAEARPQLVHLHSSKAGLAGRFALRGTIPTVFQPHGWSFLALGPSRARAAVVWERLAARWTHAFVLVSADEERRGRELRLFGRARTLVVANTVDAARFAPARPAERVERRAALGFDDDPIAVCVGRLTRQEGQDRLVAAWPAVLAAIPTARLVLVGDGPDRSALEAAAPPNVSLLGDRTDVASILQAADLYVTAAQWGGMPIAMLEAMACELPVVATGAEGVAQTVGTGAGAVVEPDPAELAAAIVARLRDRDLARAEGRRGRAEVIAHHRPEATRRAVLDLYARLIGPIPVEGSVTAGVGEGESGHAS